MKTKKRAKKVWRIFRFTQRFELPDNIRFNRKRPLLYIRDYVGSGQDDESINYKRQINACKASPNRHKLIAVFADLRDIAANYSKCFRGYILDEKFEPASINKIAGWVGLNIKETGKILQELGQIGLIERVDVPKFDLKVNDDESGKKSKSRARSRKSEKKRKPLKKKNKSESGNSNSKKKKKTGKPEPVKSKETKTSIAQLGDETTGKRQRNTPEYPRNPKGSDDGVGGNNNSRKYTVPPRKSILSQYRQTEQLGDVLHKLYNPEAEEFARKVYKAIGTPYPIDSQEGHSELACFKQAWAEAQIAGIAPSYLAEIWDRTITEANKLKAKRRRKSIKWRSSPEAVLRWLFKKFLASAKLRAGQASKRCAIGAG